MPRDLLVMLPPAMATAQDLLERGFAAACPLDVEVIDARADDYLDSDIGARLESEIMGTRHARLWLMGISLGGWGVREAAAVALLSQAGIPASEAAALSVGIGIAALIAALPGAFMLPMTWRTPSPAL